MEKVDLVIVGAEGVVESGGIINKVCPGKESIFSSDRNTSGDTHLNNRCHVDEV